MQERRDILNDTIAAISTAAGEGGISVIRISGPDTYRIADDIFAGSGPPPSRREPFTFAYGHVTDVGGRMIDEVLMLFMRAPRSYTREDMVEIHGHGGGIQSRQLLRRVLEAGARSAEPGEFTRRAFLHGRIDLTQAEAVLDLIRARSDRAAGAAIDQLGGFITKRVTNIYDNAMSVAGDLEATMDFPEDELPEAVMADIRQRLDGVDRDMAELLSTWGEGRVLREGVLAVIAGKPNVGKSTLLNALLGSERAIVSDVPGTTRDHIEEVWILDGIPIRLVDTAGLLLADCRIEQEGIRRSREWIRRADLFLYLVEAAKGIDDEDLENLAAIDKSKCIIIINKCDAATPPSRPSGFGAVVDMSLLQGDGLGRLRDSVTHVLGDVERHGREQHAAISERHRDLIARAKSEVAGAISKVDAGREDQIPLACEHLRTALEHLGLVTGRVYQQALLDSIFSRFCIGK